MDNAVIEYKKRRQKRLDAKAVEQYRIRREARLHGRMDADGDEENNGGGKRGHGNTRLPFGLCQRFGIQIGKDWGPSEAWDALADKGITPKGAFDRLKRGYDPGDPGSDEEFVDISSLAAITKKAFTAESATEYLKNIKEREQKRKEEEKRIQDELWATKSVRDNALLDYKNTQKSIDNFRKMLEDDSIDDITRLRCSRAIEKYKTWQKNLSEQVDKYTKTEKELQEKLEGLKSGFKDYEKERIKEAIEAKYPSWDNCNTSQEVLERADALALADSKYGRVAAAVKSAEKHNVKYFKPEKTATKLSDDEIIQSLGGGDMTKGSCASLCMAYIAKKMGYDVNDFRGGSSQSTFSHECRSLMKGVGAEEETNRDGYKSAHATLDKMVEGKEYWFECGRHAAIVRKTEKGYEYLELQSSSNNGWFPLTDRTLKNRFALHRTRSHAGIRFDISSSIVDIEKAMNDPAFQAVFGFINTAEGERKMGRSGYAK